MSFSSLGLSQPLAKVVTEKGYKIPTPIQAEAIPTVLEGRDIMAAAQTGTGKTAGFTLPILQRLSEGVPAQANQVRALVLTPTRELAAQVGESVRTYSKYLPLIRSTVVFGGVKINPQMMALRRGVDVLVATPGRLLDLYGQNAIKFKHLEVVVLDEADRMLDMGFIHDIRRILQLLPAKRQSLLFSATFSDAVRKLAKGLIHNPVEISVTPRNAAASTVSHRLHPVDKRKKAAVLRHLVQTENWSQVLVFSRTKHGANKVAKFLLDNDIQSAAIHGNKSQSARTKALSDFKSGKLQVLVATDIAARGLDIDQLPYVVNLDLPQVPEDYVHRIGRTGRAGTSGHAVSLVSADEIEQLTAIERVIQKKIPRDYVDGFEPIHELPESALNTSPKRPNRPKNPNTGNHGVREQREDSGSTKAQKKKTAGNRASAYKSNRSAGARSPSGRPTNK